MQYIGSTDSTVYKSMMKWTYQINGHFVYNICIQLVAFIVVLGMVKLIMDP